MCKIMSLQILFTPRCMRETVKRLLSRGSLNNSLHVFSRLLSMGTIEEERCSEIRGHA